MLNLLAFWLCGMSTGITAAVAFLRLLRDFLPIVTREVTATVAIFTRAPAQIIIGVLMLLAALITAGRSARQPAGVTVPAGGPFAQVPQPSTPTVFCRLLARAQHVLGGEHLWVAFVAGLGSATNPVEYLLALAAIVASRAAIGTQISAAHVHRVVPWSPRSARLLSGYAGANPGGHAAVARLGADSPPPDHRRHRRRGRDLLRGHRHRQHLSWPAAGWTRLR